MNNSSKDKLKYFTLKSIKAAKVSEISETTATSSVPKEERVNFHIGNPVQDQRLYSTYLRNVFGINSQKIDVSDFTYEKLIEYPEFSSFSELRFGFLKNLIKNCSPYLPRGGYLKENPGYLIQYFLNWLNKSEQESLNYDLGEKSGKREIILASGGTLESLRILFRVLSEHLELKPANIFIYGFDLPDHLRSFPNLIINKIPDNETKIIDFLTDSLNRSTEKPSYILLGKIPSEDVRRQLRYLSRAYPLFFVELNNAPNHLSLSREAKMMDLVLRFLTPSIFHPTLENLSIVFIAGNSDYLKLIETIHFQYKGTPSASEVEFLSYLLKEELNKRGKKESDKEVELINDGNKYSSLSHRTIGNYASRFENEIKYILDKRINSIEEKIDGLSEKSDRIITDFLSRHKQLIFDYFAPYKIDNMLEELFVNFSSIEWVENLIKSFAIVFNKQHPEYNINNLTVVSGSARTALGLLGNHCGITDVFIPDLSWTYEHCFPKVQSVPLTEKFQLDVEKITGRIEEKLRDDPSFPNHGAFVINNPHNATGQIFDEGDVRKIIQFIVERKIYLIDDLSYQNVIPRKDSQGIKTIRQIAKEMIALGQIRESSLKYIISVHSLSKTDCLAGARLCVIEINEDTLKNEFRTVNRYILPNTAAIFLSYLFYRNNPEFVSFYYNLRNEIFYDRMTSIQGAVEELPRERNSFDIDIIPAKGSMYPRLIINKLPDGLSLDWLAANLARQGIGLIPLSTFARTESGYRIARKSFRLTLGGGDNAEILRKKTRRVLIDLNRMIAEEKANYTKHRQDILEYSYLLKDNKGEANWNNLETKIYSACRQNMDKKFHIFYNKYFKPEYIEEFRNLFLPERLKIFSNKYSERLSIIKCITTLKRSEKVNRIFENLEKEFYKDNLERKSIEFKLRLFDRTVHPTQMYSIKAESLFDHILDLISAGTEPSQSLINELADQLIKEYFGVNVPINSSEESTELLCDLKTLIQTESYSELFLDGCLKPFLSFWGDWDGSNRPSGQGHRLISAVLIENVVRQSRLIKILYALDKKCNIEPAVLREIENLSEKNISFKKLLDEITSLTHQLEKRYKGILPFSIEPGAFRKIGMRLHIAKDPVTSLWQHNDSLESKMLNLRSKRRDSLSYYFSLNKKLRKILYSLLPAVRRNINNDIILTEFGLYKDLLRRFALTPRIHQNLVTAQDPFAIDTTVHNIQELNDISSKYGSPGMIFALQVSMSSKPEALALLDRKLRSRREYSLRENSDADSPIVSLIPLFEDAKSVKNIKNYLNTIWDYSFQSKKINQEVRERFAEIISEIFIAGSDLSQQVSQAAGLALYKEAKLEIFNWLAERDLIDSIRIKMGSGEPMQRQGGNYSPFSGEKAFIDIENNTKRLSKYLNESTRKSAEYAVTPLMGVFASGDLRTFQSNISEKLRNLKINKRADLLFHISKAQEFYRNELYRASEPLTETRLQFQSHGLQEIERLTVGRRDSIYSQFLDILTDNFRQILYGKDEDVVGIHIISYFIARTSPPLRDRPTIRPGKGVTGERGHKILEKIAETIPFSKYGSLLRAIAHNQAQTIVLGYNQLTTGLFRALDIFAQKQLPEGESMALIIDRILPYLPVYEILHSLRIFHDYDLQFIEKMEKAFPGGNSALLALKEDNSSIKKYIPLFQRELLRRHGLDVTDFFENDVFITDLLPTLRPDLCVLLQPDIFNIDINKISLSNSNVSSLWEKEVRRLLDVPVLIKSLRIKTWELLEKPIFQRVESFVDLAVSLHSITIDFEKKEIPYDTKKYRITSNIKNYLKSSSNDTIQEYLTSAYEYLSMLSQNMLEVPTNIIRALKEVERIIQIEEQALKSAEQDLLRFYLLQIARISEENG